ncbi:MAG: DNA polymerase III subunit delta, partial [Bacteroidales bacterium]
ITEWREFISKHPNESIEQWLKYLDSENAQPRIYVNESDNIVRKMSLSTYSSRYKVMIIWLPERMQPECANKLLKIIEEPFLDSIFILVSDNPKEILQTIYSRTQRFELKRLTTQQIAGYLSQTYSIDIAEATAIAAPADGDIIVAEDALMLNNENKEFLELFMQLMRISYVRDIKGLKKWSESVSALKREKCRRFLTYCARMLRENFIYNMHINSINYLNREEESFSRKFSPFINERNVEAIFKQITTAESDIHANANAKIVLFDLALQITLLIK